MANNYALRKNGRTSGRLRRFLSRVFINEKLYNWFGCILLGLIAVGFGLLLATRVEVGFILVAVVGGLCVMIPSLASGMTNLYFIVYYNFFIYAVTRMVNSDVIKPGIGFDAFLVFGMLGFVLRREHLKTASNHLFKTPVMTWMLVLYVYTCIELFNPLAHSFDGWYDTFRKSTENFALFFIAYQVLTSWKKVDRFLFALFWASFLVGLYGCIQQWHGLFPFEMAQMLKIKEGTASIWFGGQIRKFSTVSSPTGFGMDMAGTATIFIILGLNEARRSRRLLYLLGSIPMILGMTYSGTRTSTIMLLAGLGLYGLLHMDKKQTRMYAGLGLMILLVAIKLPYYGNATLNRFRSSFEGKHDESYLVREVNRKRIQPYILEHPIGGGLGTTNNAGLKWNPGHALAGFQTDNGHLKTALEMGWIGLIISLALLFVIMRTGVRDFFRETDSWKKGVIAACTGSLFAFALGDLAQEGLGEFTNVAIFYPAVAILVRARILDEQTRI
jgi:hypothetical protein